MRLTNYEIEQYLNSLEKESKAIKSEILKLCWHMRGGITYNDGMLLSNQERELIGEIVKEHIETTNKTGLNFF